MAIDKAKRTDKQWTMNDGKGLQILIHPNGSKYFPLRYTLHGKSKLVRLGIYPDLSLANGYWWIQE